MAQIGVTLDYPANYDQTWAPVCHVDNNSQYLLHGQPSVEMIIDCEFLAPMLTPVIAGQINVIDCMSGTPVKAVYKVPRYYASLPSKATKCGPGRTCGDVVAQLDAPELFQVTVEESSFPIYDDMCVDGGCGAHPMANEVSGIDQLMQAQFDTFQQIIDIRFLKYVYSPVKDNLAVASVTSAPTKAITTPTGAKTVVDYAVLRESWETALVTELAVGDDALAMGYDETVVPTHITAAELQPLGICCLDGEGLRRTIAHIQQLVTSAFKTAPSKAGMLIVANPLDIPYVVLQEMRQTAYLGTTLANPFANPELKPDMMVSEHEAYNIGGHTLVLSYMAPQGKVLFLPEEVRMSINFAQSPFKTQVNDASSCDWEKWHLAKKAFGWFIPECYRDKYYTVEVPVDCATQAVCPTP